MKSPSLPQIANIQKQLLQWYRKNGRDLPWRRTRNPYAIWVSEIMLQQTQVSTVIPYYQNFLKSFPTVRHLAKANLTKVLKVWEGLGYYSRARNLHRASEIVSNHFNGKIPDNLTDLRTLPGIGRYTAGAILSIAFNKEAPILDGNVKRVLSRLYAITGRPDKTETRLWRLSESLIPKGEAGSFNQGLMDLGAMICTPKEPQCLQCPLRDLCKGRASGDPERFPRKIVKKKIPLIESISAVIQRNGKVLLRQRPPRGLLGGLWEFPNWKDEVKRSSGFRLRNCIKKEMGMTAEVKEFIGTFRQTFSHFKLTLHVFRGQHLSGKGIGRWIPVKDLALFPMSRIHRRIALGLRNAD
ncbi:MAG TPA: A/G-specific adenine glycosylase [Thermodesulfobacteriota bacterium]|nr:A/G-specific adenine glycosylase [Thermodesulfobacteriota bacterium]